MKPRTYPSSSVNYNSVVTYPTEILHQKKSLARLDYNELRKNV